ncbi:hypothetical protein [Undibacterium sp.]|uniref:hypothetical protein n=1 Tax=Undibacterium sp. TaxID=1914977 RepID=UPI003750B05E
MSSSDPKYVTGNRPVNQRTTPPPDVTTQAIHPVLKGRMAAMKAKHQFGAPLTDQLHRSRGKSKPSRISATIIFCAVLVTVFSLGLAIAAMEKSILITSISLLGLLFGLGFLYRSVRTKRIAHEAIIHVSPLFNETCLNAFDRVLEQSGKELEEDMVAQLNCIKAQILRIAKLADHADMNEHFSIEDRHYLSESLQRYLPDSLQNYLQIPSTARASELINTTQTANDLLRQQLTLFQSEFDKYEQKLTRNAAEHLLRQQRFLEAKTKSK